MKYNFDQIPNRKISHCRKWDDSILKNGSVTTNG